MYPLKASLDAQLLAQNTSKQDENYTLTLDNLIKRLKELQSEVSAQKNDGLVEAIPDAAVQAFLAKNPDQPILNTLKGAAFTLGKVKTSLFASKSDKIIAEAIEVVKKSGVDMGDVEAVEIELKRKILDMLLADKPAYAQLSMSKLTSEAMKKMGFDSKDDAASESSVKDENEAEEESVKDGTDTSNTSTVVNSDSDTDVPEKDETTAEIKKC